MNKFVNPRCGKCGHYKNNICLLTNLEVDKNDLCRNYTESPYICEICGNHLTLKKVIFTYGQNNPFHMICPTCISFINTCQTCKSVNTCKFVEDQTISEPPYIMKQNVIEQLRQGPAIIQQQVKNPKRINLTCKVNCPCFINEQCNRENGSCDKYQCSVENW